MRWLMGVLLAVVCLLQAQAGEGGTVIQKATEQFENAPLKTITLGNGVFIFSGDGGNITAIADDASTLLIDKRNRFAGY